MIEITRLFYGSSGFDFIDVFESPLEILKKMNKEKFLELTSMVDNKKVIVNQYKIIYMIPFKVNK
jgi:hypothetical protein